MKKIVLILITFINLIGYAAEENVTTGILNRGDQVVVVELKDSNLSKKEMEKKLNSLKKEIDNESIKFYNEGILRIGYQEEFNKQSEELLKAVYSNYMKNLKTKNKKNKLKSSQKNG
ncbi:MAG: hypothetical protein WBG30_11170 [Psychrilyobacter sp.]|uniref:hypothetical protein n=1 Tax=Psychrilyobacter sp. TaxID=2586924 RepID=UPI003C7434D0